MSLFVTLRSIVAAAVLVMAIGCGSTAFAQKPVERSASSLSGNQIAFRVRSDYPNALDIAFYSDARSAAWPGGRRVWTLRDSKIHRYVLNCRRGEKICYGAAVRNVYSKYWGVGIGNKHRCASCCHRCMGNETKVIVLNP